MCSRVGKAAGFGPGTPAPHARRAEAAFRRRFGRARVPGDRGLSSAGSPAPLKVKDLSREELQNAYLQAITAVSDAISPWPDWILQFASGDTGPVLVRQSRDARLLVVGTREHVGLGRLVSSSVSHYCLSHAVCPVVAVRPPLLIAVPTIPT
jgi:nucleotide-binding universal stress UspA family protein